MGERMPKLKVYMLGQFYMTYGDVTISFKRNSATKALKLLQILLHAAGMGEGISRVKLQEELYGREELADVSNNLRVTVHRLKKMLADVGLPTYDYILVEKGVYKWNAPMELYVDSADFVQKIQGAKQIKDQEKKMSLLLEACRLYRGEFLQALSGEDWVIVNSIHYKNMYEEALTQVCQYYMEKGQYQLVKELASVAAEIHPFDEWQSVKIDAMLALEMYDEAYKYYEETSKMFFEELGIDPSEKMMKQFKEMSQKMGHSFQNSEAIEKNLRETVKETGAFYCTLPSFRDSYRLLQRIIERNGQSAYLMVCSITDGQGKNLESKEKLEVLSEHLHRAIKQSIRRGDCFTKYSPSQFLILLVGAKMENCSTIFERILTHFSSNHKSWRQYIEYTVSSVVEIEGTDSNFHFEENKLLWK